MAVAMCLAMVGLMVMLAVSIGNIEAGLALAVYGYMNGNHPSLAGGVNNRERNCWTWWNNNSNSWNGGPISISIGRMRINRCRTGDRDRMIVFLKLLILIFIFICSSVGFIMLSRLAHPRISQKALRVLKITGLSLSMAMISLLYCVKGFELLILIAFGFLLFAIGSSLIWRSEC
jgi:hypothetical protein